jgi:hypothetical protein
MSLMVAAIRVLQFQHQQNNLSLIEERSLLVLVR